MKPWGWKSWGLREKPQTSIERCEAFRSKGEICFESRTKKPTDLLNSMLNYGYAILASEITKSILFNGLDPYCGLLHFDMDNRTSLTFDLIEPFRQQIVDKTVISLVNRKQVTLEDMDKRNNTIKLKARKLIVEKILSKVYSTITYADETVSYSDLIVKQSENLVNSLLHGEKFKGFYLRWWGNLHVISAREMMSSKLVKNNYDNVLYNHWFWGKPSIKSSAKMMSSQNFLKKTYKHFK